MRHRIVFLTLAAFLLSLFASGPTAGETVSSGIFKINMSACGPKGKGFSQTGFRAYWNGQHGILTALHGVCGCSNYYAIQDKSEGGIYLNDLKFVAVDVDRDVAFLSSKQLASVAGGPLTKAKHNTAQDRLKVIGYPDGTISQVDSQLRYHDNPLRQFGKWHERIAIYCAKRKSPSCDINVLLVAEEPLIPGHSGAPILNQYNQVIGIADGGLKGGYALLNWVIPYTDVNLVPVSQQASSLNSLKQQDITELFASISTINESKYPAGSGAEISGRILYGGYNSSPIGISTNYTRAYAIIQLWDSETRKEVPVDFAYDNRSGTYIMKNVPVGKFAINVRLESGYPFYKESGGDFISHLSGLNEDIVVAPHDNRISRDLKVVYSIHLKQPVDNQKERTFTTDLPESLRQSDGYFEWDPVPAAAYYEVFLNLGDARTHEIKQSIVNNYRTNSTVFRTNLQVTSPSTYYMFRVAAFDARGSLIGHFTNYYKNGFGGWFEFVVH